MAGTAAATTESTHSITALEQQGGEGPAVPGFRDSQVADKLADDHGKADADKSVTTRVYEQMVTFQRLVTGGVTLAVGILVYNEVVGALPDSNGAINQTAVNGPVESAFTLAPIALLVIVAALILNQVMGFGGN